MPSKNVNKSRKSRVGTKNTKTSAFSDDTLSIIKIGRVKNSEIVINSKGKK